MPENVSGDKEGLLKKLINFVDETNILILALLPPVIGFGSFIILTLLWSIFSGGNMQPSDSCTSIIIGIVCLFSSLAGFAEIYRKEAPGPFMQIIKGKLAVLSGVLIVIMMGIPGIWLLLSGLFELLFPKE